MGRFRDIYGYSSGKFSTVNNNDNNNYNNNNIIIMCQDWILATLWFYYVSGPGLDASDTVGYRTEMAPPSQSSVH